MGKRDKSKPVATALGSLFASVVFILKILTDEKNGINHLKFQTWTHLAF